MNRCRPGRRGGGRGYGFAQLTVADGASGVDETAASHNRQWLTGATGAWARLADLHN